MPDIATIVGTIAAEKAPPLIAALLRIRFQRSRGSKVITLTRAAASSPLFWPRRALPCGHRALARGNSKLGTRALERLAEATGWSVFMPGVV
jgi:hypothetical protein